MERAFTVYTKCRCFLTAFLPSPSLPVCLICSCVWLVLVFFSSPVARRYLGWVQPLLEDLSYALWRIHKVPKPRSLPLPLLYVPLITEGEHQERLPDWARELDKGSPWRYWWWERVFHWLSQAASYFLSLIYSGFWMRILRMSSALFSYREAWVRCYFEPNLNLTRICVFPWFPCYLEVVSLFVSGGWWFYYEFSSSATPHQFFIC